MQMTITVHHDFSSLDRVLDKLMALLGGTPDVYQAAKAFHQQFPVPSTDGAAGVSAPVAPSTPQEPAAPAPTPPADAQPKRRGRPRKNAAPEAAAPAAPETPAADPFTPAALAAPAPAASAKISEAEMTNLRTRCLRMVELAGEKRYMEIRAEFGNPRIPDMTREQFDRFLAAVETELQKHGE